MKTNIFQGNTLINKKIADILGCDNEEDIEYGWFTEDIYFQTFFYLSKRFGHPEIYDDYKDAGVWSFSVKEFSIQIYMNSSRVQFMVFGRIGNHSVHSPYVVKYQRCWRAKRDNLVSMHSEEHTDKERVILRKLFETFKVENGIDEEKITDEEFKKQFGMAWWEYINSYNNRILTLDGFHEKYGEVYQNSYTRYALRTLEQFLKNMLTPIWIRDVPYNIKGRLSDGEALLESRYQDNVKIEYKN